MDRQTIIGFLAILTIFYVWQVQRTREAAGEAVGAPEIVTVETDPAAPTPTFDAPDVSTLEVKQLPFEGCGVEASFTTDGGVLQDIRLPAYPGHAEAQPLWSWAMSGFPRPWTPWGEDPGAEQVATASAAVLGVGAGLNSSPSPRVEVLSSSESRLEVRGVTADGIEVRRVIATEGTEPCVLTSEVTWTNRTDAVYRGGLWVSVHDSLNPDASYYTNALRSYAMTDEDVEMYTSFDDLLEEPDVREGPVQWFGLADRYFAALLLPQPGSTGRLQFSARKVGELDLFGQHFRVDTPLEAGASHSERFRMFVGPRKSETLAAVDDDLPAIIAYEFGYFAAASAPLLWLLKFLHGYLGNWGLAIIALTVTVKTLFFPLTQGAFKSSQAMQAIQPKMKEIREKFKDNPEELNRATVELFRENGVNPVGGCLPMLLQMPVWFALYRVLLNSVELYHTDFLYLRDLSEVDPYCVLPAVVVCLMLVQQRMMPTANMDPTQARMMQFMPLIFGLFFFAFPSGLVIYIFVNMILTIAQQWYIRRQFEQTGTPAVATP